MNLQKLKKEVNQLKQDMGKTDKPSIQGFFEWCEPYYQRPVNLGELWFSEYTIIYPNGAGKRVKSNKSLFLKLSDKYFRKMHNTDNPLKDGNRPLGSLKDILLRHWFAKYKPSELLKPFDRERLRDDPDYNKWFYDKWEEFIETEDIGVFNDIFEDD